MDRGLRHGPTTACPACGASVALADAFGPIGARVFPCGACTMWFGPGAPSDDLVIDLRDGAVSTSPEVHEVWAVSTTP